MSENPKHRIVAELPDGNGVIVEPLCELCGDGEQMAITCPICRRTFCIEGCFEVHFNARDSQDAPDRVDAYLRTAHAHHLFDTMIEDPAVDWRHALACDNCKPHLRDAAMRMLVDGALLTLQQKKEAV